MNCITFHPLQCIHSLKHLCRQTSPFPAPLSMDVTCHLHPAIAHRERTTTIVTDSCYHGSSTVRIFLEMNTNEPRLSVIRGRREFLHDRRERLAIFCHLLTSFSSFSWYFLILSIVVQCMCESSISSKKEK